MTNYSRGSNFERRVCQWYEEQGYDAIRSAGSHGTVDVYATLGSLHIYNTLRLNNYWSPVEREQFEAYTKRHQPCIGRYVWRGDKHDNYKIVFKEV